MIEATPTRSLQDTQFALPLEFCRALVAQLVLEGTSSIRLKDPRDRSGFGAILQTLGTDASSRLEEQGRDDKWYRTLVWLRSRLSQGNSPSYDSFETALRELQHSTVEHPNPSYVFMTHVISPSFAQVVLSRLTDRQRKLVARAASAFQEARSN